MGGDLFVNALLLECVCCDFAASVFLGLPNKKSKQSVSDAESDFGWCEGEVYYDPEDDDLCFE